MSAKQVFNTPWSSLNMLLHGDDKEFSVECLKGGVAAGETMAICGQVRSGRSAVAMWIAGYFIGTHKKRVAFITNEEERVRYGVGMATAGVPITNTANSPVVPFQAGPDWLEVVPPWDVDGVKKAHDDVGVVVVDDMLDIADLAPTLRLRAMKRDIPIFFTVCLGRCGTIERDMPDAVSSSVDHVLLVNPTLDRRFILLELVQSRIGAKGCLLIDGFTFKEVL